MWRVLMALVLLAAVAAPALADEAGNVFVPTGCVYVPDLVRWVCPDAGNNFLAGGNVETQAGGDSGSGDSGVGSGAGSGGGSGAGPGPGSGGK